MFKKSRKDTIVEQAQGLAHDISEAIAPHAQRAREEIAPRLADARDAVAPKLADARGVVAPKLADARDAVAPRLADARDAVAPKLADARDAVGPRLAEARDQAAPYVESARERFVKEVVPAVQHALEDAREQAAPVAQEAKRRGVLAAAALKGEPVKKKGGKRKFVLIAALAGLGAYAAKKLTGNKESANWQSSYTPTPAPAAPAAAPATPPSPSAPMAGSAAADVPVEEAAAGSQEIVGASPGEAISDSVDQPHPVTTPDSPAEDVDVSDVEDPKP